MSEMKRCHEVIYLKRLAKCFRGFSGYVIRNRTIGVMSASSATIGRMAFVFCVMHPIPRSRFYSIQSTLDTFQYPRINQINYQTCSHDHSSRFDLFSLRPPWV